MIFVLSFITLFASCAAINTKEYFELPSTWEKQGGQYVCSSKVCDIWIYAGSLFGLWDLVLEGNLKDKIQIQILDFYRVRTTVFETPTNNQESRISVILELDEANAILIESGFLSSLHQFYLVERCSTCSNLSPKAVTSLLVPAETTSILYGKTFAEEIEIYGAVQVASGPAILETHAIIVHSGAVLDLTTEFSFLLRCRSKGTQPCIQVEDGGLVMLEGKPASLNYTQRLVNAYDKTIEVAGDSTDLNHTIYNATFDRFVTWNPKATTETPAPSNFNSVQWLYPKSATSDILTFESSIEFSYDESSCAEDERQCPKLANIGRSFVIEVESNSFLNISEGAQVYLSNVQMRDLHGSVSATAWIQSDTSEKQSSSSFLSMINCTLQVSFSNELTIPTLEFGGKTLVEDFIMISPLCPREGCIKVKSENVELKSVAIVQSSLLTMKTIRDSESTVNSVGIKIVPSIRSYLFTEDIQDFKFEDIMIHGSDVSIFYEPQDTRTTGLGSFLNDGLERTVNFISKAILSASGYAGVMIRHEGEFETRDIQLKMNDILTINCPIGIFSSELRVLLDEIQMIRPVVGMIASSPWHLMNNAASNQVAAVECQRIQVDFNDCDDGLYVELMNRFSSLTRKSLAIGVFSGNDININILRMTTDVSCQDYVSGFGLIQKIAEFNEKNVAAPMNFRVQNLISDSNLNEPVLFVHDDQEIEVNQDFSLSGYQGWMELMFEVSLPPSSSSSNGIGLTGNVESRWATLFANPLHLPEKIDSCVKVNKGSFQGWLCPYCSDCLARLQFENIFTGQNESDIIDMNVMTRQGSRYFKLLTFSNILVRVGMSYELQSISSSSRLESGIHIKAFGIEVEENENYDTGCELFCIVFEMNFISKAIFFSSSTQNMLILQYSFEQDYLGAETINDDIEVVVDTVVEKVKIEFHNGNDGIDLYQDEGCLDYLCSIGEYRQDQICREDCAGDIYSYQINFSDIPYTYDSFSQLSPDIANMFLAIYLSLPTGAFINCEITATNLQVKLTLPISTTGFLPQGTTPEEGTGTDAKSTQGIATSPVPSQGPQLTPPVDTSSPDRLSTSQQDQEPTSGPIDIEPATEKNESYFEALIATAVSAFLIIFVVVIVLTGQIKRRRFVMENVEQINLDEADQFGSFASENDFVPVIDFDGIKDQDQVVFEIFMAIIQSNNQIFDSDLNLKDSNLNIEIDGKGNTLLHWAACLSSTKAIKSLVVNGASVHSTNHDGWQPLHMACMHGATMETIKILQNASANINAVTLEGDMPIFIAAKQGYDRTLEHLLQTADFFAQDNRGMNVLMNSIALAQHESIDIIVTHLQQCLTDGDVDRFLSQVDESGWSCFHWAASVGDSNTIDSLLQLPRVNLKMLDQVGNNPLHIGCRECSQKVVNSMLKLMAKQPNHMFSALNQRNYASRTPEEEAYNSGNVVIYNQVQSARLSLARQLNQSASPIESLMDEDVHANKDEHVIQVRKARRRQIWHKRQQEEKMKMENLKKQVDGLTTQQSALDHEIAHLQHQRKILMQMAAQSSSSPPGSFNMDTSMPGSPLLNSSFQPTIETSV